MITMQTAAKSGIVLGLLAWLAFGGAACADGISGVLDAQETELWLRSNR